jgi:hypothetical protein
MNDKAILELAFMLSLMILGIFTAIYGVRKGN